MSKKDKTDLSEKPPLFPGWGGWYAAVLINLAFWIGVFYLITVCLD